MPERRRFESPTPEQRIDVFVCRDSLALVRSAARVKGAAFAGVPVLPWSMRVRGP
jgi:hypothetical protein